MKKKIYIIEDNRLNMKFMNDFLGNLGYETIMSSTGNDAVETIKNSEPGLVIMDIQLPERTGIEITREIRRQKDISNIPIIAVSAFRVEDNEEEISSAGFNEFINKPFDINEFASVIEKYI